MAITQTTSNPLTARDRWEIAGGFINTVADAYVTVREGPTAPETLSPSLISTKRDTSLSESLSTALLIGGALVLTVVAVRALA